MYFLLVTNKFARKANKVLNSQEKQDSLEYVMNLLIHNPFDKRLRSHKVQTKDNGVAYSSRVTGDIRLIWNFDTANILTLLLLDLGGHSGSNKIYK